METETQKGLDSILKNKIRVISEEIENNIIQENSSFDSLPEKTKIAIWNYKIARDEIKQSVGENSLNFNLYDELVNNKLNGVYKIN